MLKCSSDIRPSRCAQIYIKSEVPPPSAEWTVPVGHRRAALGPRIHSLGTDGIYSVQILVSLAEQEDRVEDAEQNGDPSIRMFVN